jgi:hypothetical protein
MFEFHGIAQEPMRAFQVQIRDEYLEQLYQFDAGSIEQELYAKAERGLIIVVTDNPETIFNKLGEAVKAVTYLGPTADLPEQPVYANHSAVSRVSSAPEPEHGGFAEALWTNARQYPVRARAFAIRAGLFAFLPFWHIAGSIANKILPARHEKDLTLPPPTRAVPQRGKLRGSWTSPRDVEPYRVHEPVDAPMASRTSHS